VQHFDRVERLWLTRLRWRMRGAWLWPAFLGFTLLDGVLLRVLPPYDGTPPGVVGCVLLAGVVNMILVAGVAPLLGLWVRRRRRPDLPRAIAADYAGTALVAALAGVVLLAGLAHRPARAAERERRDTVAMAVARYLDAPAVPLGLDLLQLEDDLYRVCVPGAEGGRTLCLFVATDRDPPGIRRDTERLPNAAFQRNAG
jgi:hypothetical protein